MFKKLLCLVLTLVLALSLGACTQSQTTKSGASQPQSAASQPQSAAPQKKVMLTMATGGVSGVWYPVGGILCASISKAPGLSATAQASAGGVENIRLTNQGQVELGFAMPSSTYYAIKGIETFKDKPLTNIKAVASMLPMQFQIIVRGNSNIQSLTDLKGKKVGVGAPGSGDEAAFREMLSVVGMSYDDIDEKLLSFAEQATAFKDNQLDAMFLVAGAPTSAVLDAGTNKDIRLVSISGEIRDKILAKYPYYVKEVLPANTYPFQTQPVELIGSPSIVICRADLPDDVVYQLTKALFDDAKTIQNSHNQMKGFSLENALSGISIPLHPGAEKYYKEKGIKK